MRTASISHPVSINEFNPPQPKQERCYLLRLVQSIWAQFVGLAKKLFCHSSKQTRVLSPVTQPSSAPLPFKSLVRQPLLPQNPQQNDSPLKGFEEEDEKKSSRSEPVVKTLDFESSKRFILLMKGEHINIRNEKDIRAFIEKIRPTVYAAREAVKVEICYKGLLADEGVNQLISLLKEEFDFYEFCNDYVLSPKIVAESSENISFKDGSILKIEKVIDENTIEGERTLSNSIREKGQFQKPSFASDGSHYVFIEGTRTLGTDVKYLFPLYSYDKTEIAEDGTQWLNKKIEGKELDFRVWYVREGFPRIAECIQETRKYPFQAYSVRMLEKTYFVDTPEAVQAWLKEANTLVNDNHRELSIQLPSKKNPTQKALDSLLKEHFEVKESYPHVYLFPKTIEHTKEGDRIFRRFKSGVISEFKEIKKTFFFQECAYEGERKHPSGRVEIGKFSNNEMQSLVEGTITEGKNTYYMQPKPPFEKDGWTIGHVPNAKGNNEWKVLRIKSKGDVHPTVLCELDSSKSIVDVVKDNLAKYGISTIKNLYKEEALSNEDMKTLLPLFFLPGAENAPAPIFSDPKEIVTILSIAKDLGMELNLEITKKLESGKEKSLLMCFVPTKRKTTSYLKELQAIALYDPIFFSKNAEILFTALLENETQDVLDVDFSSCAFNKENSFLRDILFKECTDEMFATFKNASKEEKVKAIHLAYVYQRFGFIDKANSLQERVWEPVFNEAMPIAAHPIQFSPLFTPSTPVKERKEIMEKQIQELRAQKLLLLKGEFENPSSMFEPKPFGDIGHLIGRQYLANIIPESSRVKVPEMYVVLPEGKELTMDVKSKSTMFTELNYFLVVWQRKIVPEARYATKEELIELVSLLETIGFADYKYLEGRSDIFNSIMLTKEGLYVTDTNYAYFQCDVINYDLLKSVVKRYADPADLDELKKLVDEKQKKYDDLKDQRIAAKKQRRAIADAADAYYGKQHTFTFTLQELK